MLISTKINSGSFAADLSAYYQSTSPSLWGCPCAAHSCGSHYSLCAPVDVASGTNTNTYALYAVSCTHSETVKDIVDVKHFLYLWCIAVFSNSFFLKLILLNVLYCILMFFGCCFFLAKLDKKKIQSSDKLQCFVYTKFPTVILWSVK